MRRTEYTVVLNGETLSTEDDLAGAISRWDLESFQHTRDHGRPTSGGITVQSWNGEVMVRDGWILHLHENGHVYLNTNLSPKEA